MFNNNAKMMYVSLCVHWSLLMNGYVKRHIQHRITTIGKFIHVQYLIKAGIAYTS